MAERRKLALITGGSRGIGRAACVRLARDGYDIVFSYRSGPDAAAETERLCAEAGAAARGVQADVRDPEDCARLLACAAEAGNGEVDVLVNNAGITRDGLLVSMKDDAFNDVIDVNLRGTFYMMRGAAKLMLRAKKGRIINISSVSGVMGNAGQVNYSASKAGIIGMTKSLARELASRHINVNAVAPGFIDTDMTAAMPESAKEGALKSIPFRETGRPEDVAAAVSFLAGEDSRYITGQVICVDGGMSI